MRARLLPSLALVGLALTFFGALVLHPTWVLYSDGSDLLGLHIPIERFLIHSWRATGELPLWCPDRFGGSPFLHDLQVAAFYPPHLILYALPETAIGPALSWLVVAHVIVAGLGMHAYARGRGLTRRGAFVAALGFMFSGKWLLHLLGGGHYMTVGLAWLPVVLLLIESAIRRRSLLRATWAGTAFALLALGTHPQWTLYAGLFLAFWTLGTALEAAGFWRGAGSVGPPVRLPGHLPAGCVERTNSVGDGGSVRFTHPTKLDSSNGMAWPIGAWLACGACAATVAVLLVAVQLVPGIEAAGQATRSVVGTPGMALSRLPMTLFSLVGPPARGMKGFDDWEYRGGLGVLWAAAALVAALAARGRARYEAGVWLGLILFAMGGAAIVQGLPGFRLFMLPARMLLIATLPAALLAGRATDALFAGPAPSAAQLDRARRLIRWAAVAAILSLAGLALVGGPKSIRGHVYWIALAALVPAARATLGRGGSDPAVRRRAGMIWTLLLLADLWAVAAPHVEVRPESAVFTRPASVDYLADRVGDRGRVLDRHVPGQVTRTPVSSPLAMMLGLESVRGYNPMDIHRFREYLQFVADADGPVPPIRQVANFPIRNQPLLDLLGVRYLVQPAADRSLDGDPRWWRVLEDPRPRTFNIFAGMAPLPAYAVYENRAALPRAFVVPSAAPLPARSRLLEALKANDFRRRVFLEAYQPEAIGSVGGVSPAAGRPGSASTGGPAATGSRFECRSSLTAKIRQYQPNRVRVEVDPDAPGFLVLTDPWFPGWSCAVDGRPARLYRADYLFRAVAVPAGRHEVVFTFAPASFRQGRLVSGATLAGVLLVSLAAVALARRRGIVPPGPHTPRPIEIGHRPSVARDSGGTRESLAVEIPESRVGPTSVGPDPPPDQSWPD